jgi:hypothetical protein
MFHGGINGLPGNRAKIIEKIMASIPLLPQELD